MRSRRLIHEHHLVGVLGHLAASTLVQVAGLLGLARACGRVSCEVHVMAHLNACFGNVDHLRHEVLVRHLKIFVLGLLMLCSPNRCKRANLQRVGYVIMAGSGLRERSRRALLIKHFHCCLLL